MKRLELNLNDTCEVVLTEHGAKHINARRAALYSRFTSLEPSDKHFTGEVYRTQVWALFHDFAGQMGIGMKPPFESCKVVVEQEES